MPDIRVEVEQGDTRVTGVWIVAEGPGFVALHIDVATKRPNVVTGGDGGATRLVQILSPGWGEGPSTFVRIHGIPEDWTMQVESSRGSVLVSAYKTEARAIWPGGEA